MKGRDNIFSFSFLTPSETQHREDLNTAVSSWSCVWEFTHFFNKSLCHICIFPISSGISVFWHSPVFVLFFIAYCTLYVSYECLYSMLPVQRWKASQVDFLPDFHAKHHLLWEIYKMRSLQILCYCLLDLNVHLAVPYTCHLVHPKATIKTIKYLLFPPEIFSGKRQRNLLCLAWWLTFSPKNSSESTPPGHFHPSV